jgi:hypothetical protein
MTHGASFNVSRGPSGRRRTGASSEPYGKRGAIVHQTCAHLAQMNHKISLPRCCSCRTSSVSHSGQVMAGIGAHLIESAARTLFQIEHRPDDDLQQKGWA